ncbi:MAG: 50S ribosomal protein L19e [Candidatus Woesearchaeota archaeon]
MVNLTLQRRLAAEVMKCAPEKVRFDTSQLSDIKESITKADIKGLISSGAIYMVHSPGQSRVRARKILVQKRKGLRKGLGSREGTANARGNVRDAWIARIRKQRAILKELRDKGNLATSVYQKLFRKAKGGYFRSVRHLKLYIEEHNLFISKSKKE